MRQTPQSLRDASRLWILLIGIVLVAFVLLGLSTGSADAAPSSQEVANDTCLGCHSNETMVKTFPSGEELSLFIEGSKFQSRCAWTGRGCLCGLSPKHG